MTKNPVRSVTISAPADDVFSFLSDPARWMTAFPGDNEAADVKIMPDGLGTSARWSAKILGIPMAVTHEYREVVPGRLIVSKASAGPVLTFTLEPAGAGTRLTVEQSLDIDSPVVRVPVQAVLGRLSGHDIEAMLSNVKSILEGGEKASSETTTSGLPRTLTWTGEISIAAPPERVFELVIDPFVWLGPGVRISNLAVTPQGVGTTFQAAWKVLGVPLATRHEYTEFVPNEHFTSTAELGPVFTVSVAPETGGTRLAIRSDVIPANWAEAAVDSLVTKMSERSQSDVLAGIKTRAEALLGNAAARPGTPSDVVAAHPLLRRYYAVLGGGAFGYREGSELLPLLAADFVFEGPIAGRVSGADRFAQGVRGFIETATSISLLQAVTGADGAAVLYDADLPGGVVRFAEFFEFDGNRISRLRIQYDDADYVAKGGR